MLEIAIQLDRKEYLFTCKKPAEKVIEAFFDLTLSGKVEKANKLLVNSCLDKESLKTFEDAPEEVKSAFVSALSESLGAVANNPYVEGKTLFVPVYDPEVDAEIYQEFALKNLPFSELKQLIEKAGGRNLFKTSKNAVLDVVEEREKMEELLSEYPLLAPRIFAAITESVTNRTKIVVKKFKNSKQS